MTRVGPASPGSDDTAEVRGSAGLRPGSARDPPSAAAAPARSPEEPPSPAAAATVRSPLSAPYFQAFPFPHPILFGLDAAEREGLAAPVSGFLFL